jgi:hypothetical protein
MESDSNLPILLIGYNRPTLFNDRLNQIRNLPVKQLHISVDSSEVGPNPEILSTLERFRIDSLNFEVFLNIENTNQGLTKHVTSAISRVLEVNPAVLVIEDDISLTPDAYFALNEIYCLQKSQNLVGVIGGFSPITQPRAVNWNRWRVTPYFSVWGWVATRENWEDYNFDISEIDIQKSLAKSVSWNNLSTFQRSVWLSRFERAQLDPLHTWDIQMQYWSFLNDFVNVIPTFRLVENLGFNDPRAVHTKGRKPRWWIESDPNRSVTPQGKLSTFFSHLMQLIDSNTFIGDSRIFHFWQHTIRQKIRG